VNTFENKIASTRYLIIFVDAQQGVPVDLQGSTGLGSRPIRDVRVVPGAETPVVS
jgi:hypothetical protein